MIIFFSTLSRCAVLKCSAGPRITKAILDITKFEYWFNVPLSLKSLYVILI